MDMKAPLSAPNVNEDFEGAKAWMVDWLVNDAWKTASPRTLVHNTCKRLSAAGVPIEVFNAFILTLHPDYFGVVHRWDRETDEISSTMGSHDLWKTDMVRLTPLQNIRDGVSAYRWHICERDTHPEYPVLNDYRDIGATDYLAMRLPFQDGSPQTITFTTHREGGFSTAEISLVDEILSYLARLTEIQAINYLATVLLDTYVGHQTGTEILKGNIRRGTGQTINAIVLMTDLHSFTSLSESLPRDDLLTLLNEYFDAVGKPVLSRRGEILKFIGDAMLAIFPIDEKQQNKSAQCRAALEAITESRSLIAETNAVREAAGQPIIKFGAALHIGEVMYGNIGTAGRLDFTVIGPAVNVAARLESLTRPLEQPILLSSDFVAAADIEASPMGQHAVKGVDEPLSVFAPAPAAASN
jgi:adenylate cyclase